MRKFLRPLALASVVLFFWTAPAHAFFVHEIGASGWGMAGNNKLYANDSNYHMSSVMAAAKDPSLAGHCVEVWVDINGPENSHRAPDVFVQCGNGWHNGEFWLYQSGRYGTDFNMPTYWGWNNANDRQDILVCDINLRLRVRKPGVNCFGPDQNQPQPDVNHEAYWKSSYQHLRDLGTRGKYEEPQIIAGNIDWVRTAQDLGPGYTMVSWAMNAYMTMQPDGNLVVYDVVDQMGGARATWSTMTNIPGSYARLQGDGNLVIFAPDGRCIKHTGTNGVWNGKLHIRNDGWVVIVGTDGRHHPLGLHWC